MAACAVVPVDSILLVEVDGRCEVSNGLIEFEEPVPHETSAIVCWGIVSVKLDYLIEVLKCKLKALSAYLFSHCAKVVHSLDVPRLKTDRSEVIALSLLEFASLVPAEGTVVVGLEMLLIKLDCLGVVRDRCFEVAQFSERKASVMVEVCLAWLYLDSGREALNSLLVVSSPVE